MESTAKNQWKDISEEVYREYIYRDGHVISIAYPKMLRVNESSLGGHSHRIETVAGDAYYIAPGWDPIRWRVKEGEPLFKV